MGKDKAASDAAGKQVVKDKSTGDAVGKRGRGRTRNFATIVYPESAPDEWIKILEDQKVQALISPLHENDVTPTGEPKKPHWHVILRFSSVKDEAQVKEVVATFGGVGVERVKDLRQYARYLCHLDNPDKAQYPREAVTCIGGIDYYELIMSSADETAFLGDITDFVTENHVTNFARFMRWTKRAKPDWFRVVSQGCAYYVSQLIKAERYNDPSDEPETWELVGTDGRKNTPCHYDIHGVFTVHAQKSCFLDTRAGVSVGVSPPPAAFSIIEKKVHTIGVKDFYEEGRLSWMVKSTR